MEALLNHKLKKDADEPLTKATAAPLTGCNLGAAR